MRCRKAARRPRETEAHPGNHDLHISYTGVPIKNRKGSVIGALEIVTDLTASKLAENVMRKQAAFQEEEVRKVIANLGKIAGGDMNVDIQVADTDDDTRKIGENFHEINRSLTQACNAINALVADAVMLAKAGVEGKLATRADATKHQGDFRKIVRGRQRHAGRGGRTAAATSAKALKAMADKDFTKPIDGEYPGDFGDLRDNVNSGDRQSVGRRSSRSPRAPASSPKARGRSPRAPDPGPRRPDAKRQRRGDDGLDRGTGPIGRRGQGERQRVDQGGRRRRTNWPRKAARPCRSRSNRWSRFAPVRRRSARSSR